MERFDYEYYPRNTHNYWHSEEELKAAYEQQIARAREEYALVVAEDGEEEAQALEGDIYDGHDCYAFAIDGGYCDFCGAVVPGSPVDHIIGGY